MIEKVRLAEKLAMISEFWAPKIVGEVGDFHVKLVKLEGEFVWHSHPEEDEMFLVLEGELTMRLREGEIHLLPGEFLVIPHGIEHQPFAQNEASVLLFEPKSTLNTGDAGGDRTRLAEAI